MKSFITTLSTDNYVEGVIHLAKSLEKVNSKYPLVVYVDKLLKRSTLAKLDNVGIEYITEKNRIYIPDLVREKNIKNGNPHWDNTFIKLGIFELVGFEKLVYLDSDMMVVNNIDSLFEKPHMSAVVAGKSYPGNESWITFNSGLMVIEPKEGLPKEFESLIEKVAVERNSLGDQDILQEYYNDWVDRTELHLDEGYNIFVLYIDYYIEKFNYTYTTMDKPISVVHFLGKRKPWMFKRTDKIKKYLKLILKGKIIELKVFLDYYNLEKEV